MVKETICKPGLVKISFNRAPGSGIGRTRLDRLRQRTQHSPLRFPVLMERDGQDQIVGRSISSGAALIYIRPFLEDIGSAPQREET